MGCYIKSQGYGDETNGVFDVKEINKNLTTCTCSSCLSMKINLYTGSTRLTNCIFLFKLQTHTHKN